MRGLGRDVRYALRGLARRPGFAAVAVLTIALGIGAASAAYSVVDAVVLRPLPYPDRDRLVAMWTTFDGQGDFGMSLAEQYDYAQESSALESLGSYSSASVTLTGIGASRPVPVVYSWGALYDVIGARVSRGRLPSATDARGGAAPVAVVSNDFWQGALGSDPDVLGRTIELNERPVEVVGVMAAGVGLPTESPAIWMPIARDRADITDRSGHSLEGIGRLAPGATLATVRAEIDATHARWQNVWAGSHSPGHPGHSLAASGLHDRHFGDLRAAGQLLIGAIALVLLLANANVASLLLARGEARSADLALRQALGATRSRITRQLIVESLVLSCIGGLLGLAVAVRGAQALMGLEPGNLPRVEAIGLDSRLTLFAILVTVGSGLAFGIFPALRAGTAPQRGSQRSAGPDRSLARSLSTLVVGQVGLAIMLLAGAGLLMRSVDAMAKADTGVEAEGRLAFTVSLSPPSYPTAEDINGYWGRLIADVEALPGVEQAAVTRLLPLRDGLRREGMRIDAGDVPPGESAAIAFGLVTPDYFGVSGIPVVEGREFQRTDEPTSAWVGLVNETAAREYWPNSSPLGQFVYPRFMPESAGPVTIVGVVGDVLSEGPRTSVTPQLYLNYAQLPSNQGYLRHGTLVATTSVDPKTLLSAIQPAVERIDPQVPVTELATLEDVAAGARARERFLATVLGIFAAISLVLAGMGTYGVVAYSVARRTREFGLRLALGAPRTSILGSVVHKSVRLAALGAIVGIAGALVIAPVLRSLLFGVDGRDPVALTLGPLIMSAIVVSASMWPALRASRVDPMVSLREDG